MFRDVTVSFSGHNIKWFAVLAIESFLSFYPDMRGNVVYFDDESTDGSREELQKRGIHILTWTPGLISKYLAVDGINYAALPVRCSFIYGEIISQTNTRYLLNVDGDVVFKRGGFLEEYMSLLKTGNSIVTVRNYTEIQTSFKSFMEKNPEIYKRYLPYVEKIDIDKEGLSYDTEAETLRHRESYHFKRVFFLFGIYDLGVLKGKDLVGDDLDQILPAVFNENIDTGMNFTCQLHEANEPIHWIDDKEICEYLYHWGWISSANRDDHPDHNKGRDYDMELLEALDKQGIAGIATRVGIHPIRLVRSFQLTRGKSKNIGLNSGK